MHLLARVLPRILTLGVYLAAGACASAPEAARPAGGRAGGLTGVVEDSATGAPFVGVPLAAWRDTAGLPDLWRGGEPRPPAGAARAVTDEEGRFAFPPLRPGAYALVTLVRPGAGYRVAYGVRRVCPGRAEHVRVALRPDAGCGGGGCWARVAAGPPACD